MKRELLKSYILLDLPFNASEEDIIARKTALIKIYNAEDIKKHNKNEDKINKVENAANIIIENLKRNGAPSAPHCFESSNKSIISLIITFCFVAMVCYFSFLLYL